jgi:hypothetical protein
MMHGQQNIKYNILHLVLVGLMEDFFPYKIYKLHFVSSSLLFTR